MLGVMATVTTGLLSPNSYGLNQDQAVKMAAAAASESDYDQHYDTMMNRAGGGGGGVGGESSDSEPDSSSCYQHSIHTKKTPKRNKRKNFEPRCTNVAFSDGEDGEPEMSPDERVANNNNNKNRRKTMARKLVVVQQPHHHHQRQSEQPPSSQTAQLFANPMDLSKNDSESGAATTSDSDTSDQEQDDNKTIPNSFSIHNLSKSATTTPDFQQLAAAAAAASYHAQHALLSGQQPPPAVDMREYAVNTMRELLGIYGLTAEVAESITRQLPIAAFASGQVLENLSLNHNSTSSLPTNSQTPPSQPPTPPSTPLSPKNLTLHHHQQHHLSHLANLANSAASTNLPIIPNVTITQTSPAQQAIPQRAAAAPATAKATKASNRYAQATNGGSSNGGGGGGSLQYHSAPLNLSGLEYSYNQLEQLEALRNRTLLEENHKQLMNTRGIFPHLLNFSSIKSEDGSPPPSMDTSPLNAIMAQTFNAAHHQQQQQRNHSGNGNEMLTKSQTQIDYSKYVKKFGSSLECGSAYCKDLNYREHFHCLDCNSRVFLKKEEMIRHFKWHKKRDESLQHGFMRYSPLDDCSDRYGHCCTHNKKQTHYHCIKEGCDKVYISTSDVQMHANYHRKDSAIIQEGFQRFRATEECGAVYCAFFGQRTTHFHCRRSNCRYTFKNKSDMEKHKSYHIKDEQLTRDGFKKFMKNEACPYDSCRFSKVCNHIHCIRPQCNYVLHSSGQLFSHKRKHERKDSELAYRKYKLAQSMMKSMQEGGGEPPGFEGMSLSAFAAMGSNTSESLSERNSPVSYDEDNSSAAMDLTAGDSISFDDSSNWTNSDDLWRKYCQMYSPNENCGCEFVDSEHYHCNAECCEMTFSGKEGAREHARQHDQQEQVTDMYFTLACDDHTCPYQDKEKHYHCTWGENCREVVLPGEKSFRRLEHYKMHEYSKKLSLTKDPLTMTHLATSIDGMFCRKRGRPPKNRVIEVWNEYAAGGHNLMDSPQAIFTSFKLPKPSTSTPTLLNHKDEDSDERSNGSRSPGPLSPKSGSVNYTQQGFDVFHENAKCPDVLCPYMGAMHFHCGQHRCLYVTDKEDALMAHSKDFHDSVDILDGFEFYERNVDCRLANCPSNKTNRHFHCTRANCNYSFVQYSNMAAHSRKHLEASPDEKDEQRIGVAGDKAMNLTQIDGAGKVSVVKASGTFYPLSSVPQNERKSPEVKSTAESNNDITGSNTLYGPEQSCSRPFCKLKRKYHYHCNACNQAFSEIDRLVVHVAKHSTGALTSGQMLQHAHEDNNNRSSPSPPPPPIAATAPAMKQESKIQVAPLQSLQNPPASTKDDNPYLQQQFDAYNHFTNNFPANLQFALMSQQQFLPQSYAAAALSPQLMFQHQSLMQNTLLQSQYADNMSPLAAMAANLNKRALDGAQDMSPDAKKARIQSSMRILKDEPVPEGYLRFRFNEDCQYQHCGYREHQTHFHCQRQDCGYSFCDKTRFVQHTARHERLDTLMGGDFQQYRANVSCGRSDCAYTANLGSTQNKASHFHCLKCDFVCTDTNKVVAHRRQHQKLDSIQAAGFEKFTPSQQCRSPTCQHSGKQTHYHCLQCQYAVLGLAQMSAHKYRHMEG